MGIIMLTESELRVFRVLLSNPFKQWYFSELLRASKQNSRNMVQRTINRLRSEGLLRETLLGRLRQFALRLEDDAVAGYIGMAAMRSLQKPVQLALEDLRVAVEKHTSMFSIVIFGSYAKGRQRPDSDVDAAVFIPTGKGITQLQDFIIHDTEYAPVPLHIQVIGEEEMFQMLIAKEQNVGKQIVEKHLAVHNPAIFYSIVRRAEHGFNSKLIS